MLYAPFASKLNTQKPAPQHWTNVHIGSSEYLLELDALVQKKSIAVGLYINDNKEIYERLCQNLALFEDRIGCKGELFDAKKASGVRFYRKDCDIKAHRDSWEEYISGSWIQLLLSARLSRKLGCRGEGADDSSSDRRVRS